MKKCNVANGFCGCYNQDLSTKCMLIDGPGFSRDFIDGCEYRKTMNRLEKAFKEDEAETGYPEDLNWNLNERWKKEKQKQNHNQKEE